jgi:hypothetical protein
MFRTIPILITAVVLSAGLAASELEIVEQQFRVIAQPERHRVTPPDTSPRIAKTFDAISSGSPQSPAERFSLYPVPGSFGREIFIPYFVDLLPGDSVRDYNCNRFAFTGHDGHDPYIRSFREQEIGVPVFAPMNGVVIALRDGQPDENTESNPEFLSNFVRMSHENGLITEYVHLKKDSITVRRGDYVTAGTQIGQVGSSGPSTGPHIHFGVSRDGQVIEPFSGPCRLGESWFAEQPPVWSSPIMMGGQLSNQSFADFRPAPFDDAPRTGTFLYGPQTVYFKVEMANVAADAPYRILLEAPSGATEAASGSFNRAAELASMWWGLETNLNQLGSWRVILEVDGERIKEAPFSVVAYPEEIVNRPPFPVTASIHPVGLRSWEVPECRVENPLLADPDYDVVSYRYEWRADGELVREVRSAVTADALAREFVRGGSTISCSVTASDGALETETSTAHVTVESTPRSRPVRR